MKAVRFHATGDPDALVYEDVPDAVANAGEVAIKVEAVGLNFADVMRRRGDYYPVPTPTPFTLGAEVAGTISAVGEGVSGFEVGMKVFATPGEGGYAQYVTVPAAIVIPLPEGLSFAQATALVAHGLTAAIALRKAARLGEGDSILVEGAAGGLGAFMVQLAKLYGAGRVIAAASTADKRAFAEKLGADASVDYTAPGWAAQVRELTDGRGVDIVIETAGGETTAQALDAMATFGRMIFIGLAGGEASIPASRLVASNHTVTGLYIGAYMNDPALVEVTLREIIGFVLSGKLLLHVGTVLPLSQAAEAHRLLEGRKTTGKVVLQPWA